MSFITRRTSRTLAGALTLLTALVLALISYATATGWTETLVPIDSSTRADQETPATRPSSTVLPSVTTAQGLTPNDPQSVENELVPDGPIGDHDGYIAEGEVLSPWDTNHPAVGNLDPQLLDAVRQAASDAEAEGIVMVINSGWRSERYQQMLLDEAVVTYGSEEEARKWVNTPDKSTHVTGDAVDIGYTDADYWLIENGYRYGLCQTYANEIWHFELAVAPGETCPTPLDDAAEGAGAP